ncbi:MULTISPECIES: DarT ssDNA thymidine ADP-ribosyltransferase family protein [Burkholderia]|nr:MULTISPECIES: DarT ssDNA thymidine ADP-ribosyltransferase family protein [Burkholderia]MDO5917348.1 DarT ssDNA thymidine ADP-ribosyltransferase family protein [Burkholderia cenocepacia]
MVARTIKEYAKERGIKYLVHFTRLSNLASILRHGLVCLDELDGRKISGVVNDEHRLDGTDAVCVSIGLPNYRMFYRYRKQKGNELEEWVVVVIHPSVLWELPCAFCTTNAASNRVSNVPIDQRTGLDAFQAMYDDFDDIVRADLRLMDYLPTNPQAEVLMLEGVPRKYIMGVAVEDKKMKDRIEALHPDLKVWSVKAFYSYRKDFAHWQQQQA